MCGDKKSDKCVLFEFTNWIMNASGIKALSFDVWLKSVYEEFGHICCEEVNEKERRREREKES